MTEHSKSVKQVGLYYIGRLRDARTLLSQVDAVYMTKDSLHAQVEAGSSFYSALRSEIRREVAKLLHMKPSSKGQARGRLIVVFEGFAGLVTSLKELAVERQDVQDVRREITGAIELLNTEGVRFVPMLVGEGMKDEVVAMSPYMSLLDMNMEFWNVDEILKALVQASKGFVHAIPGKVAKDTRDYLGMFAGPPELCTPFVEICASRWREVSKAKPGLTFDGFVRIYGHSMLLDAAVSVIASTSALKKEGGRENKLRASESQELTDRTQANLSYRLMSEASRSVCERFGLHCSQLGHVCPRLSRRISYLALVCLQSVTGYCEKEWNSLCAALQLPEVSDAFSGTRFEYGMAVDWSTSGPETGRTIHAEQYGLLCDSTSSISSRVAWRLLKGNRDWPALRTEILDEIDKIEGAVNQLDAEPGLMKLEAELGVRGMPWAAQSCVSPVPDVVPDEASATPNISTVSDRPCSLPSAATKTPRVDTDLGPTSSSSVANRASPNTETEMKSKNSRLKGDVRCATKDGHSLCLATLPEWREFWLLKSACADMDSKECLKDASEMEGDEASEMPADEASEMPVDETSEPHGDETSEPHGGETSGTKGREKRCSTIPPAPRNPSWYLPPRRDVNLRPHDADFGKTDSYRLLPLESDSGDIPIYNSSQYTLDEQCTDAKLHDMRTVTDRIHAIVLKVREYEILATRRKLYRREQELLGLADPGHPVDYMNMPKRATDGSKATYRDFVPGEVGSDPASYFGRGPFRDPHCATTLVAGSSNADSLKKLVRTPEETRAELARAPETVIVAKSESQLVSRSFCPPDLVKQRQHVAVVDHVQRKLRRVGLRIPYIEEMCLVKGYDVDMRDLYVALAKAGLVKVVSAVRSWVEACKIAPASLIAIATKIIDLKSAGYAGPREGEVFRCIEEFVEVNKIRIGTCVFLHSQLVYLAKHSGATPADLELLTELIKRREGRGVRNLFEEPCNDFGDISVHLRLILLAAVNVVPQGGILDTF